VNIIVVANLHRKPLVTEHLQHYRHIEHHCADYDLPVGWVDRHKILAPNSSVAGAYRAFRGHQDALAHVQTSALVFEDDAVPTTYLWPVIALTAYSFLDEFDWISLHGREYDRSQMRVHADLGHSYQLLTCDQPTKGVNGCCMAYWIKKETADRYREAEFDGMPCDWFFWKKLKGALIEPTPFRHDRSQGSLIDVGARA
jgi:hypothetical protein